MGVMKDRVNRDAESGIATVAVMPMLAGYRGYAVRFAVRAYRSTVPANALQMSNAIGFGREQLVNLYDVHGYLLLRYQEYAPDPILCQEKSTTLI